MPPSCSGTRRGVTLLELMVVLAVLATTVLLVPAVRRPDTTAPLAPVLVQARHAAVLSGRPLVLRVRPDGVWTLEGTGGDTVAHGVLAPPTDGTVAAEAPTVPLVVHLDALGGMRSAPSAPAGAARPRETIAP